MELEFNKLEFHHFFFFFLRSGINWVWETRFWVELEFHKLNFQKTVQLTKYTIEQICQHIWVWRLYIMIPFHHLFCLIYFDRYMVHYVSCSLSFYCFLVLWSFYYQPLAILIIFFNREWIAENILQLMLSINSFVIENHISIFLNGRIVSYANTIIISAFFLNDRKYSFIYKQNHNKCIML